MSIFGYKSDRAVPVAFAKLNIKSMFSTPPELKYVKNIDIIRPESKSRRETCPSSPAYGLSSS